MLQLIKQELLESTMMEKLFLIIGIFVIIEYFIPILHIGEENITRIAVATIYATIFYYIVTET